MAGRNGMNWEEDVAYRVAPLPKALRELCYIYFEETLYLSALTLLTNLLHATVSTEVKSVPELDSDAAPVEATVANPSHQQHRPIFIASPRILAFIVNLTIHPSLSTGRRGLRSSKISDPTKDTIPLLARRYIEDLIRIVGPSVGGFSLAMGFERQSTWASRVSDRSDDPSPLDGVNEQLDLEIPLKMAREGSVFNRAHDFWACLGWSMNLACRSCCDGSDHLVRSRWRDWELWLLMVVEILEASWAQQPVWEETLLYQYMKDVGLTTIVRSLFATDQHSSTTEFSEIWEKELKPPKQYDRAGSTRKKIDIDNDEYGDYFDDISTEDDEPNVLAGSTGVIVKRRSSRYLHRAAVNRAAESFAYRPEFQTAMIVDHQARKNIESDSTSWLSAWGGIAAIRIRLRIIDLLADLALNLPDQFVPYFEFVDYLHDRIKPLSIPEFNLFITSPIVSKRRPYDGCWRQTVSQMILNRAIGPSAHGAPWSTPKPWYNTTSPGTKVQIIPQDWDENSGLFDQQTLEKYYLRFAAASSSAADQAKVSLVIEYVVRMFLIHGELEVTEQLQHYVRLGIREREKKVSVREKQRDEGPWFWLQNSGRRLRALVKGSTPGA